MIKPTAVHPYHEKPLSNKKEIVSTQVEAGLFPALWDRGWGGPYKRLASPAQFV